MLRGGAAATLLQTRLWQLAARPEMQRLASAGGESFNCLVQQAVMLAAHGVYRRPVTHQP